MRFTAHCGEPVTDGGRGTELRGDFDLPSPLRHARLVRLDKLITPSRQQIDRPREADPSRQTSTDRQTDTDKHRQTETDIPRNADPNRQTETQTDRQMPIFPDLC